MKLCILSMQNVGNFGSLLQSYSLKKILTELGHKVSFISVEPNQNDNLLMYEIAENFSAETGGKGLLAKLKRIDRYSINRLAIKKLTVKQEELFEVFRQEKLQTKPQDQEQKYDYCVIGSDEVFNCNLLSAWGFTSQLFGNVRQAEHVITYAASCGSTVAENVPCAAVVKIREALSKVSAISVRDENTRGFVEKITARVADNHLDPVLVGEFNKEISAVQKMSKLPKKFCLIYSYYNRISLESDITAIKKFCYSHCMDIISVGAPQMWIEKHIVCNPFQMLELFQKAAFVITDTFHGTIFSAMYCQKFAVLVRESNKNKLHDLVKRIEVQNHLIENMSELDAAYLREHDMETFTKIINIERNRTMEYLMENIR